MSNKIRNIAIKKNCLCPYLRPKRLSSSKANLVEVALHTLKYLKSYGFEFDGVVLLQPTSPFRSTKTLKNILIKFNKNKKLNSVISISELKKNPYQSVIIKQGSGNEVTISPSEKRIVYLDGAGSGAAVQDAGISSSAATTGKAIAMAMVFG